MIYSNLVNILIAVLGNYGIRRENKKLKNEPIIKTKKAISIEGFIFIVVITICFGAVASKMGAINMINTIMNTAFDLLINTVFYIMSVAVIVGGIAGLLTEFGVVSIINKILSPLMKPLYGLPGSGAIGILTTYLSDNPAILTLAKDNNFKRYFKKYQLPALTNIGTSFGMGLIISTYIIGLGATAKESFVVPVVIGNVGAIIGSIISTRLMLIKTKKLYGTEETMDLNIECGEIPMAVRKIRTGSVGERFIGALMDGGKNGVDMGMTIIPGVLIICTLVMILTNGPGEAGNYTGEAYEGIALLPALASKASVIITPLFGFSSPECVSVPLTALGSSGAAMGAIPQLIQSNAASGNDIAVFTSMCMCWSGYLSTHVAMMDSLNFRQLTGHAIFSHTIGGLCAGIFAHLIYLAINVLTC